jgi:hypothetical protein
MICVDLKTDPNNNDDRSFKAINWDQCQEQDATLQVEVLNRLSAREQSMVYSTMGCRRCNDKDDDDEDYKDYQVGEPIVNFDSKTGVSYYTCLNNT